MYHTRSQIVWAARARSFLTSFLSIGELGATAEEESLEGTQDMESSIRFLRVVAHRLHLLLKDSEVTGFFMSTGAGCHETILQWRR